MPSQRKAFVRLPALAIALLFAAAVSATADAQSTASSASSGPLCCTVASNAVAPGTCGPPSNTSGGTSTAAVKVDSLGAQTLCPAPGNNSIEIEVPGAGATANATLVVINKEPKTGFQGACLAPDLTYIPTLPTVCYQVKAGGTTFGTHGYTVVTAPASMVFHSYSTLDTTLATANPDSYQVLLTCYPHNADGTCPVPSQAISHSCCDNGARMTALKTPNALPQYARGFASMPTLP